MLRDVVVWIDGAGVLSRPFAGSRYVLTDQKEPLAALLSRCASLSSFNVLISAESTGLNAHVSAFPPLRKTRRPMSSSISSAYCGHLPRTAEHYE